MNGTGRHAFTLPGCTLFAVVLLAALTGCTSVPKSYSAAPLGGRVVDIKTREPIAGAYVVVVYEVEMGKSGWPGVLHFEETRTDHEGRFHFKGVDKMLVPKEWLARNALLYNHDPEIYIFADGYEPDRSSGDPLDRRRWLLTHRVSTLDGDDFPLRTLDRQTFKEKYFLLLSYLNSLEGAIMGYRDTATGKAVKCEVNFIPMTRDYLIKQSEKLQREGANEKYLTPLTFPTDRDCTKQGE